MNKQRQLFTVLSVMVMAVAIIYFVISVKYDVPQIQPIAQPDYQKAPYSGSNMEETFFNFLEAERTCNIDLANSLITEQSKEIMHYTCANMAEEYKCYQNLSPADYQVYIKGDNAILHFNSYSVKEGWPFFFAREDGAWKIDFYKMAFGISMGGSGCATGWGWRNEEIVAEFCSFFSPGDCPEKTDVSIEDKLENSIEEKVSACSERGGIWGRATQDCIMPAKDAGQPCDDGSDCQADCQAELSPKEEKLLKAGYGEVILEKTGTCSEFIFGCFARVENGIVGGIMCAD